MTEIFAPGARLTDANQLGGTVTMQGTSQAAAYLSGTALLAQQMAEDEVGRKLTPQEFTISWCARVARSSMAMTSRTMS